jgi:hypothetical protein
MFEPIVLRRRSSCPSITFASQNNGESKQGSHQHDSEVTLVLWYTAMANGCLTPHYRFRKLA